MVEKRVAVKAEKKGGWAEKMVEKKAAVKVSSTVESMVGKMVPKSAELRIG